MTNAILMAAGLGSRMKPLTDSVPKPLIKVGDTPMIETVIEALLNINTVKIYVVVGYLGEQFDYLKNKYPNTEIIKNPDYNRINNISSIYYAKDKLKESDCYICEADLYISDSDIFKSTPGYSCYFGKYTEGYSEDWVFELDNDNYINRIGKFGTNCYNMVGLSYFTAEDSKILANAIETQYYRGNYETMFWDDVVNNNLDKLKLRINPVKPEQIIEIDTAEELNIINKKVKNGYRKVN